MKILKFWVRQCLYIELKKGIVKFVAFICANDRRESEYSLLIRATPIAVVRAATFVREFSVITSSRGAIFLPVRDSKMDGTSFQGAMRLKIFTGYVGSIVKRYKGRRGDEVRRRTQVGRDEGQKQRATDGVECRVSVQTHLTLPFPALRTLGPFFRAYTSTSLSRIFRLAPVCNLPYAG